MAYIRINVDIDEIYNEMDRNDKREMAEWLFDDGILSSHPNPEIRKLVKGLEAIGYGEDAKKLYNTYAPYTPGGSDLRMKEAEEETHKMDEEEKHEDSSISELDMLDLYERFLNKK